MEIFWSCMSKVSRPTPLRYYLPEEKKKMVKREEKRILKESAEWKTAKDRLHDRLHWQHAVNTAIKKQLFSQKKAMQETLLN